MNDNQRATSDKRVWLYSLEVEVMALMVLLESSGELATYQYLEGWKTRLARERQTMTTVHRGVAASLKGERHLGARRSYMSHKEFLEMMDRTTPIPCPACGVDLRKRIIAVRMGVTESHTWRTRHGWRGDNWYLAMSESGKAETVRWVREACGAHLADDPAWRVCGVIYCAA